MTPDPTVPHIVQVWRDPTRSAYWCGRCSCFEADRILADSARAVLDAVLEPHRQAQRQRVEATPTNWRNYTDDPNGGAA